MGVAAAGVWGYIQLQGPTPAAGRQAIDPRADKGAHADHVQPTRQMPGNS